MESHDRKLHLRAIPGVTQVEGRRAFIHNTVREYLAASRLDKSETSERWEVLRKWGYTEWREVVLLFLALSSSNADGRAYVDQKLTQIFRSGYRGAAFVGAAIGEGVELPETSSLLDAVVDRLLGWNPCAALFSEFTKPSPVDAFYTLADNARFRSLIWNRVVVGGSDCSTAALEFVDFQRDVSSNIDLCRLAQSADRAWIKIGALSALCEKWNDARALAELCQIVHSEDTPFELRVRAAHIVARQADWNTRKGLINPSTEPLLRLALYCGSLPSTDVEAAEGAQHVAELVLSQALAKDFTPLVGDVIERYFSVDALRLCLTDPAVPPDNQLLLLRRLARLAPNDEYLSTVANGILLSSTISVDTKRQVAEIILESDRADAVNLVEAGCRWQFHTCENRVVLADLLSRYTGDSSPLYSVLADPNCSPSAKRTAAVMLSCEGTDARAMDYLRSGALDIKSEVPERLKFVESLIRSGRGDIADEALRELSHDCAHPSYDLVGMLFELGRTEHLFAIAANPATEPALVPGIIVG